MASEETDTGRALPFPSSGLSNTFSFKLEDRKGRMHRFSCGMFLVLFSSSSNPKIRRAVMQVMDVFSFLFVAFDIPKR